MKERKYTDFEETLRSNKLAAVFRNCLRPSSSGTVDTFWPLAPPTIHVINVWFCDQIRTLPESKSLPDAVHALKGVTLNPVLGE